MKAKKIISAFAAATMMLGMISFNVQAEDKAVAYGPYDGGTGDNGIYLEDKVYTGPNYKSNLTYSPSFGEAIVEALKEQGASDIPEDPKEITVGQMQQLKGHLDLSDMNITELPTAGQGSNWPCFEAGMMNVTSIDFSGNTFTHIPYYMFYSQNSNLDGTKTYDGITEINLPDSVEYFEPLCMNSMANLETMNIPANMKYLSDGALAYCPKLNWDINDFPSGVAYGKKVFNGSTAVHGDLDKYFAEKDPKFGLVWQEETIDENANDLYSFVLVKQNCNTSVQNFSGKLRIYSTVSLTMSL